jgi:hypothetical protein
MISYVVGGLLILISLLVGSSLGLVGSTLLVVESLPALAEKLADLTEGDATVLLANVLTLLVGEEHVGGETALGCVGVLLAALLHLLAGTALGRSSLGHFEYLL